jgi:hypothetical protein
MEPISSPLLGPRFAAEVQRFAGMGAAYRHLGRRTG